jgi:hypothetical protein
MGDVAGRGRHDHDARIAVVEQRQGRVQIEAAGDDDGERLRGEPAEFALLADGGVADHRPVALDARGAGPHHDRVGAGAQRVKERPVGGSSERARAAVHGDPPINARDHVQHDAQIAVAVHAPGNQRLIGGDCRAWGVRRDQADEARGLVGLRRRHYSSGSNVSAAELMQ